MHPGSLTILNIAFLIGKNHFFLNSWKNELITEMKFSTEIRRQPLSSVMIITILNLNRLKRNRKSEEKSKYEEKWQELLTIIH